MHKKKKVAMALGAALAPVLALTLPVGNANAHGWVTNPASRQDQCAKGVVQCGDIKWEPQSVEGPKGLKSCSGGNARFSDLDNDSKGWKVHDVSRTQTFNWRLTAQHRTSTWQYFVDGTKVAEINDNGAKPPATLSHNVNFGNFTGKHKVLAVWNVYDTANAFYACIDVNIR